MKQTTETSIDVSVLQAMAHELGDAGVVSAVAEAFLAQLPERRAVIRSGLSKHDLDGARRAAHTLRSTSAMLGARALESACRRIESVDQVGGESDWDRLLHEFESAADAAAMDLPTHLATLGAPC